MGQPAEPLAYLGDRSAFGSLEQGDQLRPLRAGWRLISSTHTGGSQVGALGIALVRERARLGFSSTMAPFAAAAMAPM